MRLLPALMLGLALPAGAVMVAGAPVMAKEKAPAQQFSPAFIPGAQEAEKAAKAKDFAALKAAIDKASPAASTPDDKFVLNFYRYQLGANTQDQALLRDGVLGMLASGKAPADMAPKLEAMAGQFALQGGDVDGAIDHLTKAVAAPGADPQTYYLLAEAYFSQGVKVSGGKVTPQSQPLFVQGLGQLRKAVDGLKAAGQPVPAGYYGRGAEIARVIGSADATAWAKEGVINGGSAKSWNSLLTAFQDTHRTITRDENLDVLRLMLVSGGLTEPSSYAEYAEAALKTGLPGEAKAVIESGRAGGALKATQLADTYQLATGQIPRDKASLPASATDAAKAANGRTAALTANAYLGYGDYAKAIELYRLALQKGGVDANEVNSRLGIALARSGDLAGARTAFGAVTAGVRKEIADLWVLWLDSKRG